MLYLFPHVLQWLHASSSSPSFPSVTPATSSGTCQLRSVGPLLGKYAVVLACNRSQVVLCQQRRSRDLLVWAWCCLGLPGAAPELALL